MIRTKLIYILIFGAVILFFIITTRFVWLFGRKTLHPTVPSPDYGKFTVNCDLNVSPENDTTFPYALALFEGIQKLSNRVGVVWLLTGEAALRLTKTGGLYKRDEKTQHSTLIDTIDIFVLGDNKFKTFEFLRHLSREVKTGSMQSFYCEDEKGAPEEEKCPAVYAHGISFKARISVSSTMSEASNLFMLRHIWYELPFKYHLNRYLPFAHASYYGFKVPVPNDPVFAFSHMVPLKGSIEEAESRYQLSQGCGELFPEIRTSLDAGTNMNIAKREERNEYTKCGQYLHDHGFISLYNECLKPQERFVPLNILSNQQKTERIYTLKFEDSRDVLLYHRGTGQYKLADPNKASWSQDGQDKYVDNLLQGKRDGFFLDVGAFDGEHLSNSLFFEKMRGWDGLLIEAIPDFYDDIVRKDRKCNIMNACISDRDTHQIFDITGALSRSNALMNDGQKKRIVNNNSRVKVACKSLNDILYALNVTHIDYFSLNVEGAEIHILNHIDWNKWDIDIVGTDTSTNRTIILQVMKAKGYKHIGTVADDDFFRKEK